MKSILILIATLCLLALNAACDTYRSATDDELVAATLILEAGGENNPNAMVAVFEVLKNRADRRGTSEVIEAFRNRQFSCWNNHAKRAELYQVARKHKRWNYALEIVNGSIRGMGTNVTYGATHYHAVTVNPYWAKSMERTIQIGNHIFYREK